MATGVGIRLQTIISRMSNDRVDMVIFGATGFTGKHTVKEAVRMAEDTPFTWAIAGRRKDALELVLQEFAPESKNVKIIIADVNDEVSLRKMCEQAKVLVNCCGPYRFFGEPVVKACIATRTHLVDVSAESEFQERMQLEYNKAAEEAGVYVVGACGIGSIPTDMGVIFAQDKFGGEVNSVETYFAGWTTADIRGAAIHYGTWESMVHHVGHEGELGRLREKLYPDKLPKLQPVLKTRYLLHRIPASPGYSALLPGPDLAVAQRTQRFMFERYKQRPIQLQTYVTARTLRHVLTAGVFGGMSILLSKCGCGRSLLLKYPKFFSAGHISREGPEPEAMANLHFSITFVVKGWTKKLADPTEQHKEAPNKEMITKVTGVNPGYGATCTCLLVAALMIVKEPYRMPGNGGVLPPGAAFAKTSMIDELMKYDMKFEVVSEVVK